VFDLKDFRKKTPRIKAAWAGTDAIPLRRILGNKGKGGVL
jgi:hypothetical protein